MEKRFCTYKRVGYFKQIMAESLGLKYTGNIYASPGVLKHIRKRHGRHLSKKVRENVIEIMKNIIEEPDYVGIYKSTEEEILVELIKKVDRNILVGIEIDNNNDYIQVLTMYPITEAKIDSRLYSGKLIKWKAFK
ncbi:PBECR3 domain-containing polyvalent protein [Clostridium chauvoei]|uniref:Phage-Barnase-EndoU-ColicinE5/D-RelE like nuclease 3 domain-containing protein n=2 Tax=Clostridium chauvoei TaxID=46867 RepID=S6EQQ1_9CLOT|nr:PBECR2 nuclease fold domain-containing protein [Clostridium chauvoei]ATD54907.1 hypothetical protein BTM20_06520 [Clostridium chauvoei]ATD57414.1 hypothetical protein BTM21_06540 [Clostridium chauvoei]MBX7280479.1 hypothetical protein [Clostridium chauvoei]MBX7282964.1 hypothetical protein [Clostridium chauvoei]MBX7285481.1 hypothetical protein [Clostridium chauvoei]